MPSRRAFLRLGAYGAPLALMTHSHFIERKWLRMRPVRLTETPTVRLAHFSDLHYKGDRKFLAEVVARLNDVAPDFVCFTGDIVEEAHFLAEALDVLSGIACPLYGVPGNHEYWSKAPFAEIDECFAATGGAWLPNLVAGTGDGRCLIEGLGGLARPAHLSAQAAALLGQVDTRRDDPHGRDAAPDEAEMLSTGDDALVANPASGTPVKRILLTHYPASVNHLSGMTYDVILAGHSHGGQVRLPFIGALLVPGEVEGYDAGLYDTPAGPLYVNVGIGTWLIPVRFLCRPEITIIEL